MTGCCEHSSTSSCSIKGEKFLGWLKNINFSNRILLAGLVMDKIVHIIELQCSPTQPPEEMSLCFEDSCASIPILQGRRLGRPQKTTPMSRSGSTFIFRARPRVGGGLKSRSLSRMDFRGLITVLTEPPIRAGAPVQ